MQGKKSNLHPGGSEGSKSIYNGHMIRARKTAYREEEPEEKRMIGEERKRSGEAESRRLLLLQNTKKGVP